MPRRATAGRDAAQHWHLAGTGRVLAAWHVPAFAPAETRRETLQVVSRSLPHAVRRAAWLSGAAGPRVLAHHGAPRFGVRPTAAASEMLTRRLVPAGYDQNSSQA